MASSLSPEDIAYQQAHIHEDRGPMIVDVSILLIVVTTISVALRFLARFIQSLPLQWDDWLSAAGLVMVVLMCVENIICRL